MTWGHPHCKKPPYPSSRSRRQRRKPRAQRDREKLKTVMRCCILRKKSTVCIRLCVLCKWKPKDPNRFVREAKRLVQGDIPNLEKFPFEPMAILILLSHVSSRIVARRQANSTRVHKASEQCRVCCSRQIRSTVVCGPTANGS